MGAGGIERRNESELGVASGRLGSTDYRAAGGWKAGWERIIDWGASIGLVAGNVGAAGGIHGDGGRVRPIPVPAEKRRVNNAGSGGIQLRHKYVPVKSIAVGRRQ